MLLSPLLAYIYTVHLKLPKTLLHFYVFFILFFGFFFIIKKKNILFPRYLWFLLLYAVYGFIWLQIAEVDYHILTHIYYSILNFSIFFVVLIIYNTNFSDSFKRNSISLIKITVVLTAIVSIVQVFDSNFLNAWPYWRPDKDMALDIYSFRRASIFGFVNQNAIGLSFIPLLAVLIGYFFYEKNKNYFIYLILGGVTALLSNCRYIMVGFMIITFIILVVQKVKIIGFLKYAFVLFVIGFLLYQALVFFGYNFKSFYKERLFHEGSLYETTRYKAIKNFLIFFPKTPIFGTGVHLTDEIREASRDVGSSQIHIGYLSHLVSYGIVGSIFLFGFWFMLAKKLYRTAKLTGYWGSFFAFLTFFWAQVTLVYYSIFFTGLIFALVFDKYFQDKYRNNY